MQWRHVQECGCLIDLLRGICLLLRWGCLGGIGGTRLTAYALCCCSRTGLIDALQGVWGFVWGLFCRENFVAGKFRHPWKSQSSRLPPAHPHVQAHTLIRVRTIRKNQMATESSITSQHLKESAPPNTCPKTMDPQNAAPLASSLPSDYPKFRWGKILLPSNRFQIYSYDVLSRTGFRWMIEIFSSAFSR